MRTKEEKARLLSDRISQVDGGQGLDAVRVAVFDEPGLTLGDLYRACFRDAKGRRLVRLSPPRRPDGRVEYDARYYAWRMFVFHCSPRGQHHCIPVMLDCCGRDWHEEPTPEAREAGRRKDREDMDALDEIVDRFVAMVQPRERYGLNAWARAMYGTTPLDEAGVPTQPIDQMLAGIPMPEFHEDPKADDDPTLVGGM